MIELLKKYFNVGYLFIIKFVGMGFKYLLMLYLSAIVLDATQYGVFSLYLVILNLVYLVIGFGVIDTGMYLVSRNDDNDISGTVLILTLIISLLYTMIMSIVLYYYEFNFPLLFAIGSTGYIFNLYVKKIGVAKQNKFTMYYYELINYLATFLLIYLFGNNLTSSIFIYSTTMLVISIGFIFYLRPTFRSFKKNINLVTNEIKDYGIKVHLSQLISNGSFDLDKIMLEQLYGFASVGIYNLSLNFIMPIKLFSMSISEMLFKDFSQQKRIQKEVFIINSLFSIVGSIFMSIAGAVMIKLFYSSEYYAIFNYIYLLPILAFLSSAYVPINNFFSAHGLGKQKFINAVVLTIFNVTLNILFIPEYGVVGAITATIIALVINNLLFILQYIKYVNELKEPVNNAN